MNEQNQQVKSLAFVGGTHGNELTGVYLIPWLEENLAHTTSSFSIQTLIANPKAVRLHRRYCEKDLNRCFSLESLNRKVPPKERTEVTEDWEIDRAREINKILGPKDSADNCDFIVDIHNTTANMGASLIVGCMDEYLFYLTYEIAQLSDKIKVYYMPEDRLSSPYLPTVAKRDLCLEIGPQSPSLVRADNFELAKKISIAILGFTENWNNQSYVKKDVKLPHFLQIKNLDYPRDEKGQICGMIHPTLQDQDYQAFDAKGQSFFVDFDGNDIPNEFEGVYNPVFINEQAYYEKGIAMSLTQYRELSWKEWN